ncbi:hypothetical protein HY632_00945 [Candidatus Uhrbacteria bacterium]|nr:hypothetical protein [Candidatus Uhrbacteria bacterium]
MADALTSPPPPPPPQPPDPEDIFSAVPDPAARASAAAPVEAVPPMGERAARSGVIPKVAIASGVLLVVGIIAIVLFMVFFRDPAESDSDALLQPFTGENRRAPPAVDPFPAPAVHAPSTTPPPSDTAPPVAPDASAVTLELDTDGDGLSDAAEVEFRTDATKSDTDGDGLSDREEVRTYQTDPLKSDTDGDTFPDGKEVQNGYNPRGKGLLFEVPKG